MTEGSADSSISGVFNSSPKRSRLFSAHSASMSAIASAGLSGGSKAKKIPGLSSSRIRQSSSRRRASCNGGIDGLVHLSDISWEVVGEEAVHNYKKGQEIEAAVLAIDAERERISLGIKQLEKDPFSAWLAEHPKNTVVKGVVTEVDARGATIDLGDGVLGSLRASELARGRVEDARTVLKVGEEVEAKFTNVDRKNRTVALSIKAKEVHEEAEAISTYKSDAGAAPVGTTLGELLKEKMSGGKK